jgi:zinc protease
VKTDAIAPWEMEKARNSVKRGVVGGMTSSLNRAIQLTEDTLFYNDPNRINTEVERVNKVTAADVKRVAAKYLTQTNRSVVITNPKAASSVTKGGR